MKVYRLEHKESLKGPFEHRDKRRNQTDLVMRLGWHCDPHMMIDVKLCKELKKQGWVYGWANKKKFNSFCSVTLLKDFEKEGFKLKIYNPTNYVKLADGQIIFSKDESYMSDLILRGIKFL